ncbi:MAG: hypothetical protein H6953_07650 [Chromatiaceae bacterium]|nr:hypothetical protein [Gammaproteobacteria bacterium]MCP5305304.1 hypothetical protein [Chromatiaceae bacterium]MCP5315263.1 hypothetical protein [Chromatiaceae bacterium]
MTQADLIVTAIGLVGAAAILVTFIGNIAGRLSARSRHYLLLNLFGGVLVAFNSIWFDAYPAFLINVVWVGASVWGLRRTA